MASLLLPLNQSRTLFQAQQEKSNDIKQMLDSINKKFFRLLVKFLGFTLNQRLDTFDYPATSKQTENCLVAAELLQMDG